MSDLGFILFIAMTIVAAITFTASIFRDNKTWDRIQREAQEESTEKITKLIEGDKE